MRWFWMVLLVGTVELFFLPSTQNSNAENSVVINDQEDVPPGATIDIPVMITNDEELRCIVVTLVLRETEEGGGGFPTQIWPVFGERLPEGGPLSEVSIRNQYADEDGTCKEHYQPGGFGTITYQWTKDTTTTFNPVGSAPEGLLFTRNRLFGDNLDAGADEEGSMIITVTVGNDVGCFYVDTTCTDPYNHLVFCDWNSDPVPGLTFQSGRICIAEVGSPVAEDDTYGGARNGATLYVVGAGVLTNDTDPEGDPLTAVLGTDVGHGTLLLDPDGSFFYTPDVAFIGTDQFTYFANDGVLNSTDAGTVTLHVKGGGPVPPGDYDEDGEITAIDLAALIDALFSNSPDPTDGGCRIWPRGDFNCDAFTTAVDLALLIDYAFRSGEGPCDPCAE